jgi:hypothetical protein
MARLEMQYRLQRSDYVSAARRMLARGALLPIFGAFTVFCFLLSAAGGEGWLESGMILVAFGVAYLVALPHYFWRRLEYRDSLVSVALDHDGIHSVVEGVGSAHTHWSVYREVIETRSYFLMLPKNGWLVLPKRALRDPGEVDALRRLLGEMVAPR